jgi:hypothetical protein
MLGILWVAAQLAGIPMESDTYLNSEALGSPTDKSTLRVVSTRRHSDTADRTPLLGVKQLQ